MKQPKNKKNRESTIALYLRVSREDSGQDESNSIQNQKEIFDTFL